MRVLTYFNSHLCNFRRNLGQRPGRTGCGNQPGEPKSLVSELGGPFDLGFLDYDGDLDLGGRDQLDIDPALAQAFKHARSDPGMGTHADPDHAELGYAAFGE